MRFEYMVVPAPTRGKKVKGVKGAASRFAHALSEVMNEHATAGWEYLRTDTLPAEERTGLTGRTTVFQNMLVFRRAVSAEADAVAGAPEADAPEVDTDNLFVGDIAETHAPKLPSAKAAQASSAAPVAATVKADATRDVAAE